MRRASAPRPAGPRATGGPATLALGAALLALEARALAVVLRARASPAPAGTHRSVPSVLGIVGTLVARRRVRDPSREVPAYGDVRGWPPGSGGVRRDPARRWIGRGAGRRGTTISRAADRERPPPSGGRPHDGERPVLGLVDGGEPGVAQPPREVLRRADVAEDPEAAQQPDRVVVAIARGTDDGRQPQLAAGPEDAPDSASAAAARRSSAAR